MDVDMIDHKLCGFLSAVLSFTSPSLHALQQTLDFGTPCHIFGDGPDVGFKTENGIILSPIDSSSELRPAQPSGLVSNQEAEQCKDAERETVVKDNCEDLCRTPKECGSSLKREDGLERESEGLTRRRMKMIGVVNGSISVVHQLHALTMDKSLKIIARVVGVEIGHNITARAVVLVDVYLPIELWSGWQFPKSKSIAAALFRHLSCDWRERSVLIDSKNYWGSVNRRTESIWNLSGCHVLGCKLHCGVPGSSKRRLFELHEIFKSLPSVSSKEKLDTSRIKPSAHSSGSGIWDITDDIILKILNTLSPMDLVRVAATCHHFRSLTKSVMPCMKLKLFPHQRAAVEWMLQRERNAEVLPNPLHTKFLTEDGFHFYINGVSGDILTGTEPTIRDFRGGMFCDEPGLGKTITTLSLILKTQGTVANPPDGVKVFWCTHNGDQRCAYYECSGERLGKRFLSPHSRRGKLCLDQFSPMDKLNNSPKNATLKDPDQQNTESNDSYLGKGMKSLLAPDSRSAPRSTRSLSRIRKNLLHAYDGASNFCEGKRVEKKKTMKKRGSGNLKDVVLEHEVTYSRKRKRTIDHHAQDDTWVQCDACYKWRKLLDTSVAGATSTWFCSMNTDPSYQSCNDSEEVWDKHQPITSLLGFYTKGTSGGEVQNVSFFTNVLKEHYALMDSKVNKALTWLANLPASKLSEMETIGLNTPILSSRVSFDVHGFHKIFQAFGLIGRKEKGVTRWYYPQTLDNLAFDLRALSMALCEPLDSIRLYLSRATLIVVPANLVDHWSAQIQRHVRRGQLRICLWTDHKKPLAHSLAWDYDVVITTFSRLSAEWAPHKKSPLMQVHWYRVVLDEGHTLGSSLNMTNKLQLAISLTASSRWLLTGTPTPNTPNNQLSHLQPLLKFLHEEAYGQNQKAWEAGILRPFEAEMEEGRSRLLQLLNRCMISARKIDLQTIPPCIKKVKYVDFAEEHARSYNELVVTVRRNILMADWNDPSHVESLLNPKQWRFRSTTIKNVRLSCCVAGHIKVSDAGEDIQETMDMLVENDLKPSSEEYVFIKYNLLYGGNCYRCKEWCRLPIITPCRHFLCLDCVALDSEKCTMPGCGNLYEMQTPETLARPENPNPKWAVPKDLIELQPSYKQDDWNPDWKSTSSSKVSYLVERLNVLQEANTQLSLSLGEENHAKRMEKFLSSSNFSNSSAFMQSNCFRLGLESDNDLPEKVIIFSQFLEHIHVIEQQLTMAGIKFTAMYSPMHSSNKMKSLAVFQHEPRCLALLMDGSAALGLDLSFVTHVFLMEPIWDRSMEEQVISRAHRMGANRPIHVETLAMRGTIEEQMLRFLQDNDECKSFMKECGKPEREVTRNHRTVHDFAENNYLSRLSFVPTNTKGRRLGAGRQRGVDG